MHKLYQKADILHVWSRDDFFLKGEECLIPQKLITSPKRCCPKRKRLRDFGLHSPVSRIVNNIFKRLRTSSETSSTGVVRRRPDRHSQPWKRREVKTMSKKLVGSFKGAKWTAFFGCFVKQMKTQRVGVWKCSNPDLIISYKNVWHQCHIVHQSLQLLTSASLDPIHSKTVSLSRGL